MKYVVVGGLSVDHVINAAGEKRLDQFGGNGAYGSAGARIWAGPNAVGLVARYGDTFPEEWIRRAAAAGIDTLGVRRYPGEHTLLGGLIYDERGDRDSYVSKDDVMQAREKGEKRDMSPLTLHRAQVDFGADGTDIPARYADAEAVLLAPRYLNKQRSCVDFFANNGKTPRIIVDPMHFYMNLERSEDMAGLFSRVDVVLPSEAEITHLLGPCDPLVGAKYLAELGARTVVVKLGGEGCMVYQAESDAVVRLPIHPADVSDPTGAGDSFCGGFMVGLAETGDPVEAAMYGTVSSSFVVEGFGADYTYSVTREMAEKRLATLKQRIAGGKFSG
ncbi:MAG: carbohydrate kinase family protein [Planctomycetes bacterium]|nr:carbohydrate kinase family protein [Planctomycetota bacterium]